MKVKGEGGRMSLSIFLREKKDELNKYKIVKDVEANFSKVRLGEHKEDERILSQIEKATIVNCNAFIDRFGFKLDSGFLSTGCKAALEVVRCGEEEIIDLMECGMNARDCIISNCKSGNILISRPECRISDYTEEDLVDVFVYGKHFTSMRALSQYLEEI